MAGEVERLPRLLLFIWLTQKPEGGLAGIVSGWGSRVVCPAPPANHNSRWVWGRQSNPGRERVRSDAYLILNYAQQGNQPGWLEQLLASLVSLGMCQKEQTKNASVSAAELVVSPTARGIS